MTEIPDVYNPQRDETVWLVYKTPPHYPFGGRRLTGMIETINLPHLTVLMSDGTRIPCLWQPGCDKLDPSLFVFAPEYDWPTDLKQYVANKDIRVIRNSWMPGFQLLCPICYAVLRDITADTEMRWLAYSADKNSFCVGKMAQRDTFHRVECDCCHEFQYDAPAVKDEF